MVKLYQFMEDAQMEAPKIITETYTDEQLINNGLVKVEAFVRTKASSAAIRKARQRQKEEIAGLKTVTVTAPADIKPVLQLIAKESAEGKQLKDIITNDMQSVTSHAFVTLDETTKVKIEIGNKVMNLTRWKKTLAKILGIL